MTDLMCSNQNLMVAAVALLSIGVALLMGIFILVREGSKIPVVDDDTDHEDDCDDTDYGKAADEEGGEPSRTKDDYRLNTNKSVAVDPTNRFMSMEFCPRGVKVQLLGPGHVATYGIWDGKDTQWLGWYPVPGSAR